MFQDGVEMHAHETDCSLMGITIDVTIDGFIDGSRAVFRIGPSYSTNLSK